MRIRRRSYKNQQRRRRQVGEDVAGRLRCLQEELQAMRISKSELQASIRSTSKRLSRLADQADRNNISLQIADMKFELAGLSERIGLQEECIEDLEQNTSRRRGSKHATAESRCAKMLAESTKVITREIMCKTGALLRESAQHRESLCAKRETDYYYTDSVTLTESAADGMADDASGESTVPTSAPSSQRRQQKASKWLILTSEEDCDILSFVGEQEISRE